MNDNNHLLLKRIKVNMKIHFLNQAKKRSASIAAWQPIPAAVIA